MQTHGTHIANCIRARVKYIRRPTLKKQQLNLKSDNRHHHANWTAILSQPTGLTTKQCKMEKQKIDKTKK